MADTNISVACRNLIVKTIKDSVIYRLPVLTRMLQRNRVTWKGGPAIQRPVSIATMESLAQSYVPNDTLDAGDKTLLALPTFYWKYCQVPITYDIKMKLANSGGGDTQVVDFIKFLVEQAHRGMRLKLRSMMYAAGATARDSEDNAAAPEFQSINDALTVDITYGGKSRSVKATNLWWQGADTEGTWVSSTGQALSMAPTIDNVRRMVNVIDLDKRSDLLMVVGATNFQRLQAQIEAQKLYKEGDLVKYGFQSFTIDGLEVVLEPWLEDIANNSAYATSKKYAYILNIPDWEYRINPERAFDVTPFVWQGDVAGGTDKWLGREMLAGNMVCWRPQASILKTNFW